MAYCSLLFFRQIILNWISIFLMHLAMHHRAWKMVTFGMIIIDFWQNFHWELNNTRSYLFLLWYWFGNYAPALHLFALTASHLYSVISTHFSIPLVLLPKPNFLPPPQTHTLTAKVRHFNYIVTAQFSHAQ